MTSPLGTLIEPGTLRIERTLPAAVGRVWACLREPDERAKWLAGGTLAQRRARCSSCISNTRS